MVATIVEEPVKAPESIQAAIASPAPEPASVMPSGPVTAALIDPAPSSTQGKMFEWAVSGGDLGVHKLNDQLMTTLSATYGGEHVHDYAISAGALPTAIKLNNTRGVLSGTLLQTGHYVFTIRATIESTSSDATYNLTVQ